MKVGNSKVNIRDCIMQSFISVEKKYISKMGFRKIKNKKLVDLINWAHYSIKSR